MNSGIACLFVLETAEKKANAMNNDKIWRLRRQTEKNSLLKGQGVDGRV
jgi:hypothetical protein